MQAERLRSRWRRDAAKIDVHDGERVQNSREHSVTPVRREEDFVQRARQDAPEAPSQSSRKMHDSSARECDDAGRGFVSPESSRNRRGGHRTVKIVEMADATAALAEYAQKVATEPVIVTTNGKPIAALVPIENADFETASLSMNPKFLALIQRSRVRHQAEGGMSSDEMRRRLESGT